MKISKEFEIAGTIVAVIPTGKVVTVVICPGKDWRGEYENIPVKVFGKSAPEAATLQPGENVRACGVDISGQEYKGRYNAQISAWKIERIGAAQQAQAQPPPASAPSPAAPAQTAQPATPENPSDDSMPF